MSSKVILDCDDPPCGGYIMRNLLIPVLMVVGCGGSKGSSAPAPAKAPLIPAGTYKLGKDVVGDVETPATGDAKVVVTHEGDKIRFTLSGQLTPDYSCEVREWLVKLNSSGVAKSVERTQENCTDSLPKEEWESFRRSYRVVEAGFVERIETGDVVIEIYYDRLPVD